MCNIAAARCERELLHSGYSPVGRRLLMPQCICAARQLREGWVHLQVALKFILQSGKAVIPRSSSQAHVAELLPGQLSQFTFSGPELQVLANLDGKRSVAG